MKPDMNANTYAIDRAGAVATKIGAVTKILMGKTLTMANLDEIQHHMTYMRNSLKFLTPEMQDTVMTIFAAASMRMARDGTWDDDVEVKPFGNSGHVILPNTLVGRRIAYVVLPGRALDDAA
jgi:hypothetical protein